MICYVPNDRLPETNNNRPSTWIVTVKEKKPKKNVGNIIETNAR